MKLVCPHCAKIIDIAESLAGLTTSCPLCQGPWTVPFAPAAVPPANVAPAGPPTSPPPLPPPPPSPPPPDPLGATTAWPPPRGASVVPPLPQPHSPGPRPSGRGVEILGKLQQWILPAGFHEWFGVGVLTAIFFLFFFPWVGIYIGDQRLVDQSGFGIAFGSSSTSPEGQLLTKGLSGSSLLVLAFLASIVGFLTLLVMLVEKLVHSPAVQNIRPTLQKIVGLRDHIVLACLGLITLVFLLFYLFMSFPLEQAAHGEKAADLIQNGLKLRAESNEAIKLNEMVAAQLLTRRCWFTFAVLIALIATLWTGYRWLGERGYTCRWPQVIIQWPASDLPVVTFDGANSHGTEGTSSSSSSTAP